MRKDAKVAKGTEGAKINAEAQRKQRTQRKVFSVFSVNFCVFRVFFSIGVNLCQSVERDAKAAKGTKDAKEVTQRRRGSKGRQERHPDTQATR